MAQTQTTFGRASAQAIRRADGCLRRVRPPSRRRMWCRDIKFVVPTTQPAKLLRFNFRDASIDAVLKYLSDEAGFTILEIKPATGTVTMYTINPITPDEAVVYLNSRPERHGSDSDSDGQAIEDRLAG